MLKQLTQVFLILTFALVESTPVVDIKESIDTKGQHWFGPVRRCPLGEDFVVDKCISKIVQEITPLVGHGIRELGLEPLDPILIDKFVYENKVGPIKFIVEASNMKIFELPNYKDLNFHFDHVNKLMHFVYVSKKITISTNFAITGTLFGVPFKFASPIQFDIHGIRAEGNMHLYKTFNDNKEVIIQLKDAKIDNLENHEFKLVRLFDRNPILNSIAQGAFHELGPQAFDVIEPQVARFVGDVIANRLLNPILEKLPYIADFID